MAAGGLWPEEKGAWMETGGAQFSFDLRKVFFSHKGGEALQRGWETTSLG